MMPLEELEGDADDVEVYTLPDWIFYDDGN